MMAASDRPASEPTHPDDPRGDLTWGTTSRLLTMTAHRIPAAEAVVDGHLRLTYQGLDAEVTRAARAFLATGPSRVVSQARPWVRLVEIRTADRGAEVLPEFSFRGHEQHVSVACRVELVADAVGHPAVPGGRRW